ncbi:hypothetical protein BDQ17DRAFT_1409952 [Cyathus striatus]|nr:hypothetical protein BDQ17DRAFT_1409952 [Cyathus striatus]
MDVMAAVHEEVPVATSAFSNGKNQAVNNANILNASGNITYIECNPQLTQAIVDALLNVSSDARLPGIPPASSSTHTTLDSTSLDSDLQTEGINIPLQELNTTMESPISANVNLDKDEGEAAGSPESDTSVNTISSFDILFLPSETLSRSPSGHKIYVEKMFPLNYGFPLWFPEPNRYLPLEYRRKGISIGDVGIITPNGGFDFLFNISLPAEHPVNPNDLPDDFIYIPESKLRRVFQISFNPGALSVVSNLDISAELDDDTNDIIFTCQDGNKGAILSMPDGASEEDLTNEWDLKEFISKNALTWYRYARHCGLELGRRSLYLVTGHMKSKLWGIATFSKTVPERNSVLSINFIVREHVENDVGGPGLTDVLTNENSQDECHKSWNGNKKLYGEDRTGSGAQSSCSKNLGNNINVTSFPARHTLLHPLSVINDMLFSMVPEAHIAIIHDNSCRELISQLNHGADGLDLHEIIKSRFIIAYNEETGMCTLEPRKDDSLYLFNSNINPLAEIDCSPDSGNKQSRSHKGLEPFSGASGLRELMFFSDTDPQVDLSELILEDFASESLFEINSYSSAETHLPPWPLPSSSSSSFASESPNNMFGTDYYSSAGGSLPPWLLPNSNTSSFASESLNNMFDIGSYPSAGAGLPPRLLPSSNTSSPDTISSGSTPYTPVDSDSINSAASNPFSFSLKISDPVLHTTVNSNIPEVPVYPSAGKNRITAVGMSHKTD